MSAPASVTTTSALPTWGAVVADAPLTAALTAEVHAHRAAVRRILDGQDDRLLVIAGPCSVHDPAAGLDYARQLAATAVPYAGELLVVLRAYLEKPRSVLGWKGLVHDPDLDGTGDLARGLVLGRRFLLDAVQAGLPLATEFLEPLVAPYLADVVSYGAIGARTVASQPHRNLASWLPMPVGCKNGVDGDVGVAVDAIRASTAPHAFPGVDEAGRPVVQRSAGNSHAHLVLRGGASGPNHDRRSVAASLARLSAAGLPPRLVVDASHGNSGKDHRRQPVVVRDLADQVRTGTSGIVGVMLESFIHEGRHDHPAPYGVSITDACQDLTTTAGLLDVLADAVDQGRRAAT